MGDAVAPNVAATYELLDTRPTVKLARGRRPARRRARQPRIRGRDVRSHGGQVVLDGLSFSIAEGETVALVGGIGSGKSTVFNLLLRFLDPQRGRILLDGHDIAGVTIASLRDQVLQTCPIPVLHEGQHPRERPVGAAGKQAKLRSRRPANRPTFTPSSRTR